MGEVFVTSLAHDADLLLKAMRAGAKEFLAQPVDELEVKTALTAFKRRMRQSSPKEADRNGQIIHLMGAKGGWGPPRSPSTWP